MTVAADLNQVLVVALALLAQFACSLLAVQLHQHKLSLAGNALAAGVIAGVFLPRFLTPAADESSLVFTGFLLGGFVGVVLWLLQTISAKRSQAD